MKTMDINRVTELRTATTDYFGVGAIQKFNDIAQTLKSEGINKVMVVSSKSAYIKTGAWDVVEPALRANGIEYILYNKVTPNPTDRQTDEATEAGRAFGAQAVIGIGGGSPIDTAKSVAVMLEYPEYNTKDLYTFKFTPTTAKPIIAINTTHGTGTEVNRFAVVTISDLEYKPAIAYDCLYPTYAIDDPALMTKLPLRQTLYVSIDAVNHVTEAATTQLTNPLAILLAKETISLVHEWLPEVIKNPENLEARYWLTYAAAMAGTSFDNGLLHLTHALEHPLSAIRPELSHGLGLAMILPAVVKEIYASQAEILAEIYAPIVPGLKGTPDEADTIAAGIEKWLFDLGVTEKLSDLNFTDDDVERLLSLTRETPSLDGLLAIAPVEATDDVIRNIYKSSMKKIS